MSQFFAWPFEWLWLFVPVSLLPWLFRWLLPQAPRNTNTALKVPFYNHVAPLANENTAQKPIWKIQSLAWLIWLLLVLAAMRPQWLGEPIQLQISGRDLLLAVDLSKSMAEQDCINKERSPNNRLSIVKSVLSEFIERRKGDRIGLIVFGTKAYVQTPLTFDHVIVKTQLEQETFIGLAGEKTAIADAIGLAVKLLRNRLQENRVLILLTDGNNTSHQVKPLQAAQLAKKHGVRVYTIGIGTDNVCKCNEFGDCYLEKTALDEKTLQAIADTTGGQYFRARERASLENIYRALDEYEPVTEEQKTFRPKIPLYPWFLGAAFFLSVLMAYLRARRH
jgi:Ca-activated chloride channel family protein